MGDTCKRFAAIIDTIFPIRYANRYFIVNGERLGGDPERYREQFDRYGNGIQAIQINLVDDIDANHWTMKSMLAHMSHITKFTFDSCTFKTDEIFTQPSQHITHLIFQQNFDVSEYVTLPDIVLPECCNLTHLEFHEYVELDISGRSVERIIRNNPMLQSILLYNFDFGYLNFREILTSIAESLKQIKELGLVSRQNSYQRQDTDDPDQIARILRKNADTFEHLKSLDLSIFELDAQSIQILQHFGSVCKQVEQFRLRVINVDLCIGLYDLLDDTDTLLGVLLNLHVINLDCDRKVLPLLQKYKTLDKVTINFGELDEVYPANFIRANFFKQFIETINGNRNARIEVKKRGKIIGIVSKDGIVWRNKWMCWPGCNVNSSNIRLLDLADHPHNSQLQINEQEQNVAGQLHLLDSIFDYLDMASLDSLANIGRRSKQLIKSYVKKHLDKRGAFTITDDLCSIGYFNRRHIFRGADLAERVTALNVQLFNYSGKGTVSDIIQDFRHVERLSVYDEYPDCEWPGFLWNVSHIIYDSSFVLNYWPLKHIIDRFPNAETIEFKNAGAFKSFHSLYSHTINALKKVIFNYVCEIQMKNLTEIFVNTEIELVPIRPNADRATQKHN